MKKLSLCGRIRRIRYPATPEGRRKYIQDSLTKDDSFRLYRIKERIYAVLIVVTCFGLLVTVILLLTSK